MNNFDECALSFRWIGILVKQVYEQKLYLKSLKNWPQWVVREMWTKFLFGVTSVVTPPSDNKHPIHSWSHAEDHPRPALVAQGRLGWPQLWPQKGSILVNRQIIKHFNDSAVNGKRILLQGAALHSGAVSKFASILSCPRVQLITFPYSWGDRIAQRIAYLLPTQWPRVQIPAMKLWSCWG